MTLTVLLYSIGLQPRVSLKYILKCAIMYLPDLIKKGEYPTSGITIIIMVLRYSTYRTSKKFGPSNYSAPFTEH